MTLAVEGGSNLTENYVGSHFANYDYFVVLSHFKGSRDGGFRRCNRERSRLIAHEEQMPMMIKSIGAGPMLSFTRYFCCGVKFTSYAFCSAVEA